ncbi:MULTISPECIES: OmpA family protein [unclassified Bacteroides]|jgi:outer membrane protein OmpA-like peptidoglycan-associated protein|uniref:OmpA family protein n=1 Tax=unclassified Bacteroides TaxID=2646097 RepID=UPI000E9DCBFD|nr:MULTISPECIES: OmpA family protein [unclassified Bacteroides]RGN47573.1 OmpA family protein [Bacteroides sp. OM05-12]RHR75409.1 OmpA family protein [Bacteroides sp. AF16-49]
MKKGTLIIMALLFMPLLSHGQNSQEEKVDNSIENDKYRVITNKFWDNWFITAGAGAQVMFGDDDEKGKFGKRISPAINVGVGKWFTPGLGLRLQYNGLNAKGFSYGNGGYIKGTPDSKGLYKEKINYMNLHGDIMFNLTNMFCGYKEDRVYNAIPYLGFGLVHRYNEDVYGFKKLFFGLNLGYINKFRLSKAWDFNLEASALMMRDDFDSKTEGKKMDAVISVTAGFTYRFKQRGFKKAIVKTTGLSSEEMDAIRNKLNEQIARNKELEAELAKEKNKKPEIVKEEVIKPVQVASSSPRAIFFTINEYSISPREKVNIEYIAEQIKSNPDKQFTITGYADNSTGSASFNQELTQKRAESVYNMLVNDYGVDAKQLKIEAKGGVSSMFEPSSLNRVVIVE